MEKESVQHGCVLSSVVMRKGSQLDMQQMLPAHFYDWKILLLLDQNFKNTLELNTLKYIFLIVFYWGFSSFDKNTVKNTEVSHLMHNSLNVLLHYLSLHKLELFNMLLLTMLIWKCSLEKPRIATISPPVSQLCVLSGTLHSTEAALWKNKSHKTIIWCPFVCAAPGGLSAQGPNKIKLTRDPNEMTARTEEMS